MDPEVAAGRAHRLLDSGLLDLEFYAALRGVDFRDPMTAALDCVTEGLPSRLTPNPFLDFTSMPDDIRRAWRNSRVQKLLNHLAETDATGPLGRPHAAGFPEGADARADLMAYAAAIGRRHALPFGSDDVRWAQVQDELSARVPGRVSVVIPTFDDAWMTVRAARSALQHSPGYDVEVVVVDNGSAPHITLRLAAELRQLAGTRLVRLPQNLNFAGGTNVGIAQSTGELLLFLNNDTVARRGWLPPLVSALHDDAVAGVQPLLLFEDDTIQSAGTVFVDDELLPCHILVGHPPEDAGRVLGQHFPAVTAAAALVRADDVIGVRGFDEGYRNGFEDVDLFLRLLARRPGGFRVAPTSRITHLESKTPGRYTHVMDNRARFVEAWRGRRPAADPLVFERLGFTAVVVSDGQPVAAARARVTGFANGSRRARWSLNLPSTPGSWGDDWGDTHFAENLADALRRLGQDVVTRRQGAHDTGPRDLDDVHLALRGRNRIDPQPGVTNILWVISHPDTITQDELRGFDFVFAASYPWSEEMTRASGRPVLPLLQATAVDPAAINEPFPERITEAVFAGNTEGRTRPLVHWAIEAGIPLAVFGRGWDGLLPPGVLRPGYVPPEELPNLYRRHGLVLADHWPDMARNGFVANRVLDVLASGATVACDDVSRLGDALPGLPVHVVRSADDLAQLWSGLQRSGTPKPPPSPADLRFDARARVLVSAVAQTSGKIKNRSES